MMWIVKFFADFFMALGFLCFFGAVSVIAFLNGHVENLGFEWIVLPSLAFAWLRGELYHWPREERDQQ